MAEYGIIVGSRDREGVADAFRREGHDLRLADRERGEFSSPDRRDPGRLRIHDDERHYTFRELCPLPHTIVEVDGSSALAGTMRAIVARRGGYLRDRAGRVTAAATPEGDNPDFDLLRRLDELEGIDRRARGAIAALALSDPGGFRTLADALRERAAALPGGPPVP